MKQIALEDIVTVYTSEFVKKYRDYLQYDTRYPEGTSERNTVRFLKMNYNQRRKLIEKTLNELTK